MGPIGSRVHTPSTRTDRLKPAGYARLMWLLPRQHGSIRSGACIYARQSSGIHLAHVLDIGCGTGRSSVALAEFCGHVVAIDPSQEMLDAATPHRKITFSQGAGERIPLPNRSIDIVTFAELGLGFSGRVD